MPRGAAVIAYRGKRGVVWRIKYADADGRQVQETVGAERDGVTRKQAEAELRERLVRVEKQGYRRPQPVTFNEWADTWFSECIRRRGWKPKTANTHGHRLTHLRHHFRNAKLEAIRPRDVATYIKQALTKRSARSVIAEVNLLHDLLGSAVAEELIQANPVVGVERPKAKPLRWRILEPEEVRRVAAAFTDDRARAVFLTLHLTGLRRHEIQHLRWRDLSLTEATLRVVESKSEEGERLLALSPALVELLADRYSKTPHKADTDFVFAHPQTGARLGADRYRDLLREALAKALIPDADRIRPFHDARHAALTHLALTPGASELVLMATAGHRSFATTRKYLHLAGRAFPEAAAGLSDRLLGDGNVVPRLYPPEPISGDFSPSNTAEKVA
jgi:integrase